jgi:hypothetical protein
MFLLDLLMMIEAAPPATALWEKHTKYYSSPSFYTNQ